MTPADRLAEIRARAEAAMPPAAECVCYRETDGRSADEWGKCPIGAPCIDAWMRWRLADKDFREHAREDVPYLLERVAKLQEHIDVSTVSVDEWNALKTRAEALERVAADARTAVHYSRITIGLAASIAALDALEQP